MPYRSIALLCLAGFSWVAPADAQPIEKSGDHCPTGYYASGEYCKPLGRAADNPPIPKRASACPTGYYSAGEYCKPFASRAPQKPPIPKHGASCPSGYYSAGASGYCKPFGR